MLAVEAALADCDVVETSREVDNLQIPEQYAGLLMALHVIDPQLGPRSPAAVLARGNEPDSLQVRDRMAVMELPEGDVQVTVRALQVVGSVAVGPLRVVRFNEAMPYYEASAVWIGDPELGHEPFRLGSAIYAPSAGATQPPADAAEISQWVPGVCPDDSPSQVITTIAELITDYGQQLRI